MQWLGGVGIMVLMLLLRLAVPVAITVSVGYALHRLDRKWHPTPPSPIVADNRQAAPEAPAL
jgi:hypothetical protein